MEIIELPIKSIFPYKNNPRINDDAVDYVVNSIKTFGFRVPIIIDKNRCIVAGHTRYEAAKKLGIKELPCILASELSDNQIRAFRIIDNQTQSLSSWDFSKLMTELDDIDEFDMSLYGFTKDDEEDEDGNAEESGYSGKTSNLDEGKELDLSNFDEGELNCVCPHCGFRFTE